MSRINRIPLAIAIAAVPLGVLVYAWLRPHAVPGGLALRLLDVAPNFIAALCAPFLVVVRPTRTPIEAARAFTLAALATLGVLILVEVVCAFVGIARFDPLDIIASIVGMLLAAGLYRAIAPRIAYAATGRREGSS
jgi:hypothetical protein